MSDEQNQAPVPQIPIEPTSFSPVDSPVTPILEPAVSVPVVESPVFEPVPVVQPPIAVTPVVASIEQTPAPVFNPFVAEPTAITPAEPVVPPAATGYGSGTMGETAAPVIGSGAAETPKKSKKGLFIGLIIAGVVALVGLGSSAYAYVSWHEAPQRVITDAIINAVTAKKATYTGTVTLDSEGTKLAVTLTAKQSDNTGAVDADATLTLEGEEYKVKGSAIVADNSTLYFKIENLGDLVDSYKTGLGISGAQYAEINTHIDAFVAKINNKWIKVTNDGLKELSDSYAKTQECLDTTVTKITDDKATRDELSKVYENNQFIVIDNELGTKDGNVGYQISTDTDKTKSFIVGLKDTAMYKELNACDDSFTIDESDITPPTDKDKGTIEVWISRWNHDFASLSFKSTDDDTIVDILIKPDYDSDVNIEIPTDVMTVDQVKTEFETLQANIIGG